MASIDLEKDLTRLQNALHQGEAKTKVTTFFIQILTCPATFTMTLFLPSLLSHLRKKINK